ncbi:type VII secretion-associated protein [Nocardia sp. 004]|uniref:type VII secretion-associated protein n=1 Tax=Nocardia sp. 004 TaxID=3385978 RepID=UPI0039A187B4
MSAVELVVTETRLWARGATTHWDMPPSITVGTEDSGFFIGQSLMPPAKASSVVQFLGADAIALSPRAPSVVDAMSAVFAEVLENLGTALPCERFVLICPTGWGSSRRSVLEQAAYRGAATVVFEDIAVRSVVADAGTSHSHRTLVLEFDALSTTVSTVIRSHRGVHIESCEHEPILALTEAVPGSPGFDELCALITRLLGGRSIDLVQVAGVPEPGMLDSVDEAVQQAVGKTVEIRSIAGYDLIRGGDPVPNQPRGIASNQPQIEWTQSLREHAAAQQPGRSARSYAVAMIAAITAVAVIAVTAVLLNRPGDTAAPVSAPMVSVKSEPTGNASPPNSSVPVTPEVFGRIIFQVPDNWRIASALQNGKPRIDLVPEGDLRQRITVMQTPLAVGSGYEQVVANLETQMAQRADGVLSDLRRDVDFGGRPGLAYLERPGDGSTVRWHVVVENDMQVSIGCQYLGDGWQDLSSTCEVFARSVRVIP